MRWYKRAFLFLLLMIASLIGFVLSHLINPEPTLAIQDLLAPTPRQKIGYYDYFGKELSPAESAQLVSERGLNPGDPTSYQRLGMVKVTRQLIKQGENIFFDRKIGDTFGLQGIFGFGKGLSILFPEINQAILGLGGQPTSNLTITLLKDINLGGLTLPAGSKIPTGFDVPKNGQLPIGLKPNGDITCAICHVSLSKKGELLKGVPNGDLAISLLVALAPNSVAGLARLDPINFQNPELYKLGTGKTIIDSQGNSVKLPDPETLEQLFDGALLAVPFGNFESSLDFKSNTTQIPTVFTFGTRPYLADGQFAVGPFGGVSAITNAVHSSEINLIGNRELIQASTGVDQEVYLGILLQNAADERLRLPYDGIKPSEWLRGIAPDPLKAQLEDQIPAPGTQIKPDLISPTLFTYNGLIFTPNTNNPTDIASGTFLFANNAMSAWQNSLTSPPNLSRENREALSNGSVERGARVFQEAGCVSCHIPPFFSDNQIHPVDEIGTNPARAESRLALNSLLVPPKLYTFNTPVPIPANAEVLDIPTEGISDSPTTLPKGLLPNGGYNTPSLIGLYLTAPYLHDGGVAVGKDALEIHEDGSYTIVDTSTTNPPFQWGLTGTLARVDLTNGQIDISKRMLPDSANSLRALLDSQLRAFVIAANEANPGLKISNLDGRGHDFYVDPPNGFSYRQQADLVNFLLALDEDPALFWPRTAREE